MKTLFKAIVICLLFSQSILLPAQTGKLAFVPKIQYDTATLSGKIEGVKSVEQEFKSIALRYYPTKKVWAYTLRRNRGLEVIMADRNKAIAKILIREGYIIGHSIGYVNSKTDRGGETIAGVSRKNWPNWEGWKIIDEAKQQQNFPDSLIPNLQIFQLLMDFYTINFWNVIQGDRIADQKIAESLLDGAILEGSHAAIERAEAIFHLPLTGKMTDELINKLNTLL